MKQRQIRAIFLSLGLAGAMLFSGCQSSPQQTPDAAEDTNNTPSTNEAESESEPTDDFSAEREENTDASELLVEASYLTDTASRTDLDRIMETAGISKERRDVFWAHVEQFNTCEGISGLHDGYETISATQPSYDAYELQDKWTAAHPEFIGYNCRISAFSLMGDAIKIKNTEEPNATNLFMDEQALQEDSSALMDDTELPRFLALFSTIEGENTNDAARQAELVQQAWNARGISFDSDSSMSLITVFLHNQYSETENELIVGHAGVLFDCGNDGLYFVEKLAFQAPYRAVRFQDRNALKEYLMAMYDVEWGQPTAPPFILENGSELSN